MVVVWLVDVVLDVGADVEVDVLMRSESIREAIFRHVLSAGIGTEAGERLGNWNIP